MNDSWPDCSNQTSFFDGAEHSARDLPHREKYLLLVTGFMRRYLELHLELIDTIERDMAPEPASSRRPLGAGDRSKH